MRKMFVVDFTLPDYRSKTAVTPQKKGRHMLPALCLWLPALNSGNLYTSRMGRSAGSPERTNLTRRRYLRVVDIIRQGRQLEKTRLHSLGTAVYGHRCSESHINPSVELLRIDNTYLYRT